MSLLDHSKAERELGWKPEPVEDAIRKGARFSRNTATCDELPAPPSRPVLVKRASQSRTRNSSLGETDYLLPRLQELPGFDNETFIRAVGVSEEGVFGAVAVALVLTLAWFVVRNLEFGPFTALYV